MTCTQHQGWHKQGKPTLHTGSLDVVCFDSYSFATCCMYFWYVFHVIWKNGLTAYSFVITGSHIECHYF